MPQALLYSILASFITSLVALVGIVLLFAKRQKSSLTFVLSAFAAGALLGDAFIHLLPEAAEGFGGVTPALSLTVLGGIIAFFVLERVIHIHHLHERVEGESLHPVVINSLVSDGIHNFIDGIAIAASFLVSPAIGITTTVAVILHEIPQELGDFGILLSKGLSFQKALFFNFISAVTAVAGAIVGFFLFGQIEHYLPYALAVTAGGFIYISLADLIPSLHQSPTKQRAKKISWSIYSGVASSAFLAMLAGIAVMYGLLLLEV